MNPCVSLLLPDVSFQQGDTFSVERQFYGHGASLVAGLDEAGRGPLAGPVVAACAILPKDCDYQPFRDSKQLTAPQREQLFALLQENGALVGIGMADPREIEAINILQASLLAMQRALAECVANNHGRMPDVLLVDGRHRAPVTIQQLTLIKGESKSASIAAASIIAKVTRDRLMAEAHRCYPQYGFDRHQGYPTKAHRQAIAMHGPCPLHRRTFRGVVEFLPESDPPPALPSLW
ncbi:MAG: ribonuclease HII [Proteobacteria bacterium]|nr:ribonuclease HII [Pseudomonadota bacterium]